MSDNKVFTAAQVAKELGVHLYTVYELLKSKRLEGFKLQTHWRVRRDALDEFMRKEVTR